MTKTRQINRQAFSLVEVMFAIMIIGICMSIIASIFPAAMQINRESTSSIVGQIITDNALAIAKTQLTVTKAPNGNISLTSPPANITTRLVDVTSKIGSHDLRWPSGPTNQLRGYKVLIRQMTADENDFVLVIIAYTLGKTGNTIAVAQHSGVTISSDAEQFTAAGTFQVNSPLISYDGYWSTIAGQVGNNIELSRPLSRSAAQNLTGFVTITETVDSQLPAVITPGARILTVRTALREIQP